MSNTKHKPTYRELITALELAADCMPTTAQAGDNGEADKCLDEVLLVLHAARAPGPCTCFECTGSTELQLSPQTFEGVPDNEGH